MEAKLKVGLDSYIWFSTTKSTNYQPMSKVKKDTQNSDKSKVKYQVLNWSSYNKAIVNRGDITIYFSGEVLDEWYSDLPAQRGGQLVCSDLCIETLLMIKVLFKLPYRQTQGFAGSLLKLMDLSDLNVPSFAAGQQPNKWNFI